MPTHVSGLQSQASGGSVSNDQFISVKDDKEIDKFSNKFLQLGLGQSASTPNLRESENQNEKPTYVMKFNKYGKRIAVLRP